VSTHAPLGCQSISPRPNTATPPDTTSCFLAAGGRSRSVRRVAVAGRSLIMMRRPRGCRSRPHKFCECPARDSHERRVATLHTRSNRVAECHDEQGASRLGNRPRIVHATTFRIVRGYPSTRLGARKWSFLILFRVENDPFIGFKSRPPRSKTPCENRGFRFLSRPPRLALPTASGPHSPRV
jgi:hypothetical protein